MRSRTGVCLSTVRLYAVFSIDSVGKDLPGIITNRKNMIAIPIQNLPDINFIITNLLTKSFENLP